MLEIVLGAGALVIIGVLLSVISEQKKRLDALEAANQVIAFDLAVFGLVVIRRDPETGKIDRVDPRDVVIRED